MSDRLEDFLGERRVKLDEMIARANKLLLSNEFNERTPHLTRAIKELTDFRQALERPTLRRLLSLVLRTTVGVFGMTVLSPKREKGRLEKSKAPPKSSELLLHLLLPRARRDEVLGDLSEDFAESIELRSHRFARWQYNVRVAQILWGFAGQKLMKWLLFGWVFEAVRRKIGI